ncbi:pilus assembly protein [Brenneria goodwinii]|uniref:Flp pilus assembly protein TadG n=1 Tax=Brenneria goodwinii TaxID=1109412 RepID=A0A0G4JWX7_9GAMM|nr:TadE/TadG family type IV pilus assembly protein [Brenneria goodwinii]MCG8157093.1 pilus assembly protein [Brenneria goodwinii]MCG8160167.1 pilus assembly protein [Brenneria goodwinii]MCG8164690.1 pilus assembly protein [Brenneria goodwinii]MCG8170604.1 pilus assembly protein [Brenneria goodwinii]MCG8174132.1 pilus assembly protein [Brenneria goodwinii]
MIILKRFLLTLQRDQRGAAALTYLLCFPLILLALLGSIDFIRYSMAQGKLQNALDTAVISAGRNLDTFTPIPTGSDEEVKWRADAKSYFFSNMPQGFLGSSIAEDNVAINYSVETDGSGNATGAQLVSMTATGTLPLLVTGMIKKTAFNLSATNGAVRRTRSDLEMVLALDNTGSMANENRIATLKTSAAQLVDTVLGAAQAQGGNSQSFIGIVPFADTVYIGRKKVRWLSSDARTLPYIAADKHWGGCVVEPYVNNTFKAESGLPGSFEPLMTVGTLSEVNGLKTTAYLKTRDAPNAKDYRILPGSKPKISGNRSISAELENESGNIIPKFAFNSEYLQWQYGFVRSNNCPQSREMLFLSNNVDELKNKINAMTVDGRTIIPLGLLWSWRMLDPNWRGTDGWGDGEKPHDAAIGLNKVIVLLTDGNNGLDPITNKANTSVGVVIDGERDIPVDYTISYQYQFKKSKNSAWSTDSASHTFHIDKLNDDNTPYFTCGSICAYANSSDFNSLRVGSETELGNSSTEIKPYGKLFQSGSDWQVGNTTLNNLTARLCTNIRAEGITIYTVVLGSGTNVSTQTLMQNCSSGTGSHYFNATNVNNLPAAFAAIAASLTELRLTE